ncbi:hypothetical protein SAMD00019534_008750 [Acytostelium subglobosum LB1]|uniref:hypothetical protein n=1 Tax=Acytostelium subglobosum LB1 TaxID=1410327 RepID=UPI0006449396|nr:hypothetical protein SAMD00019534_008750 [Acytostelium subglobosum LB1]GAM17700.1 hypothetical protein SAMD00019534_008750 [Acytostelium subglobosum LB1]|eukprot:XP_012758296.1 hypothetical protein SAMD00019534_008750 [Acytostelium subglobosum LB1]
MDSNENSVLLKEEYDIKGYDDEQYENGQSGSLFSKWLPKTRRNRLILLVLLILIVCTIIATVVPLVILSKGRHTVVLSHNCQDDGGKLVNTALKGTQAYSKLKTMCTTFGNRLSGSDALEKAIDWVQAQMIADGLENVQTQDVNVTHWVRGNEHAAILSPFTKRMNILGLGGSINTTANGVTAEVLVVSSFDDLVNKSALCPKKIVLFNVPFTEYGVTVAYRSGGAVAAAKCGGVAALVRSITPFSIGSPHTGMMSYRDGVNKIPTAAITLEDADLIQGLSDQGTVVSVNLYMEAQTMPNPAVSRNVMGQVTGSMYPEQVVVIGGHIDSWDVGQGAVDDGGGVMVAWEAVRLMKALGIQPLRTVRVVAWTNEENGAAGAQTYANVHRNETFFSIETDGGTTTPLGFTVSGASEATIDALQSLSDDVLSELGANLVIEGESGTDNSFLIVPGQIPGGELSVDMSKYFWYHHSEGDALDKVDPHQMDQCVASMASMSLCIANFNGPLPK